MPIRLFKELLHAPAAACCNLCRLERQIKNAL